MKNMKFKDNILEILDRTRDGKFNFVTNLSNSESVVLIHCLMKLGVDKIYSMGEFMVYKDISIDMANIPYNLYGSDTYYTIKTTDEGSALCLGNIKDFKNVKPNTINALKFSDLLEPIDNESINKADFTKNKINCSNAINFIKERTRMCETIECVGCKMDAIIGDYETEQEGELNCADFIEKYPDVAVDIVQEWSDKNPKYKTYIDDFREKIPKADISDKDIMWSLCRKKIYQDENMSEYCDAISSIRICEKCWNAKMKEDK